MDPTARPPALPLAASVALGAVAGFVDAVCFDQLFGVFPANQSGNAIFLGVALGDGSAGQVWPPATAMVGFVLGVAAAAIIRRPGRLRSPTPVLVAAEIVLLAGVALAVGPTTAVDHALTDPRGAALLLVTAIAMGVQTEIIRSHAGVSISTTYQTGALTHLAEEVAGAAPHRAERRGPGIGPIAVLSSVLVGYIGGAAFGARLGGDWGGALAVPVITLVALLLTARWWDDPRRSSSGP